MSVRVRNSSGSCSGTMGSTGTAPGRSSNPSFGQRLHAGQLFFQIRHQPLTKAANQRRVPAIGSGNEPVDGERIGLEAGISPPDLDEPAFLQVICGDEMIG